MEITVIARQVLLYGHIIAFALALATILKEDVRLLRAKRIDSASLLASAKLVKWLLLALWVTGVPMVMMDIGTDVSLLFGKPKLLAKLIVVGAVTLNGILLHLVAIPMVTGKSKNPNKAATIAAMLGAVSTTSWLYASFVGAARLVAPYFSLYDFVILYLLVLAVAVPFAILVVRKRLELLLKSSDDWTDISAGQGHGQSAALLEVEIKRLLRTNHLAQQFSAHQGTSSVDKSQMTAPNRGEALHELAGKWRSPQSNQGLR
jgi:Na+-translocating ferredoxin:NAD+ oxidoreductase RnfA subunit